MSRPLAADLDHVLAHTTGLWDGLRGQRIFITGGTGFFGCWLLETFAYVTEKLDLGATAVLLTRDVDVGPTHESNRAAGELVEEILRLWPGRWEDRSDPKVVHEAGLLQLSIGKAQCLLGWSPVWSFPTAVSETVSWYHQPTAKCEMNAAQIDRMTATARAASLAWAQS